MGPPELQRDYEFQECLKSSPASRVWKARTRFDQACVIKWADESHRPFLLQEYAVLRQLNLPGIPKALDLREFGGGTCLVRAFVEGISPTQLTEPIQVMKVFQQVALLVGELHRSGHWNLDLKPGHILVDDQMYCHLIDIGGGGFTPLYASPELLGLLPEKPGRATDFYSLGLALLEVVLGRPWLDEDGDLYTSVLAFEIPRLAPRWPRGLRRDYSTRGLPNACKTPAA